MMFYIIGAIVLGLSIAAIALLLIKQGRVTEQNDQIKRVLDDLYAADTARDDLRRDPDDAKRVRARFTRELL